MNNAVVKKWIAALRSGDYTQTIRVLRSEDDTYCVIGVLCDLRAKEFYNQHSWTPIHDYYSYDGGGIIPDVIKEWLQIKWVSLNLDHLVALNDELGKTFDELAQYIEDKMNRFCPEIAG